VNRLIEFAQSMWTEKVCDDVIRMASKVPVEKATTGEKNSNSRRCNVRWLYPEPHWKPLFDEVTLLFQQANRANYGFDIAFIPEIQFTEYEGSNEGMYDWHGDINWVDSSPYHRKLSMSIQLSDSADYEGGDLEFARGSQGPSTSLLRHRGSSIVFPSFLAHRVTPVTSGKRYSLVAWIEGPQFR